MAGDPTFRTKKAGRSFLGLYCRLLENGIDVEATSCRFLRRPAARSPPPQSLSSSSDGDIAATREHAVERWQHDEREQRARHDAADHDGRERLLHLGAGAGR